MHLLAYLFDPRHPGASPPSGPGCATSGSSRGERIVAALAADGYPVVWERDRRASPPAGWSAARTSPGRWWTPGSSSRSTHAFATLLHHRSPYYVAKADTDVRRGHRAGPRRRGVPVFAHGLATKRGRVVGDDAIAAMAEAGLLGLEVDHPDHTADERAHLRGLADDLGLLRTGSSDYHGTNKTTPIAACTTDPDAVRGAAGRRHRQRALPRLTAEPSDPAVTVARMRNAARTARSSRPARHAAAAVLRPRRSRSPTFADCPRRYRYANVDRPTPPQRARRFAHNTVGTALHAAAARVVGPAVERRTHRPRRGSCCTRRGRRPASATTSSPTAGGPGRPAG